MFKKQSAKSHSKSTERNLIGALFGGVFMLGFGLPSAFGWFGLYQELISARCPMKWTQGSALIEHVALHTTHSKRGNDTYSVSTRYRYKFDGKTYWGDKIRLADFGTDNIGTYHQDWARHLQLAQELESTVSVLINPDNPNEAVLSNETRLEYILFALLFALLFGFISLCGATYAYISIARRKPAWSEYLNL